WMDTSCSQQWATRGSTRRAVRAQNATRAQYGRACNSSHVGGVDPGDFFLAISLLLHGVTRAHSYDSRWRRNSVPSSFLSDVRPLSRGGVRDLPDAVVERVGDEQVAVRIHLDSGGVPELGVLRRAAVAGEARLA